MYTPLHVHSHYSLLDGLSKPAQIADRCNSLGINSCAITDHGSLSGCVSFFQTMKKASIKPILGTEMNICDADASIKTSENNIVSHLVILAKNITGWKNLIKIISNSNQQSYYYNKPRLSIQNIKSQNTEGLLCITGYRGSTLCSKSNTDDLQPAIKHISELQDIFGKKEVFLSTQPFEWSTVLNTKIRELSKQTGSLVVVGTDAHYAEQVDAIDQRILLCSNLHTTIPDISKKIISGDNNPLTSFFTSDAFFIWEEKQLLQHIPEEEIKNTNLVSDMCDSYDILHKPELPEFIADEPEHLRQLCRDGWKSRNMNNRTNSDIYVDRVKHELGVLQDANLSGYFLIVQDIVNYVRSNNWLPGPGRGSAAGCLVSYLLGITNIDPIEHNLIFERFYNAGRNTANRVSMPDIDIDVPMTKRDNIINYIKNKYGENKVSQMITFNTMKGRGALKEVLRVYGGLSFDEMNRITKNLPEETKIAEDLQEMKDSTGEASIIRWALENNPDTFREWCYLENNELSGPFAKRFEQAIRLEGTKSNQSKHAAGIAISAQNLNEICPMVYDSKSGNAIAGMEMQDLESLGVVKFDILGIGMLDKIMNIQSILRG